jgi:hypothetical protein
MWGMGGDFKGVVLVEKSNPRPIPIGASVKSTNKFSHCIEIVSQAPFSRNVTPF